LTTGFGHKALGGTRDDIVDIVVLERLILKIRLAAVNG